MKTVNLNSVPNQSVFFSGERSEWTLSFHYFRDLSYLDVDMNGTSVVRGIRCVPNEWLVPWGTVDGAVGNFRFETTLDAYPNYRDFGTDACRLVYYTADEIDSEG